MITRSRVLSIRAEAKLCFTPALGALGIRHAEEARTGPLANDSHL